MFRSSGVIFTILLTAGCGNDGGQKNVRSVDPDAPAILSEAQKEQAAGESKPIPEEKSFKEAFALHLHPVLNKNCEACHSDGSLGFANKEVDKAMAVVVNFLGTKVEDTRLYQKIGEGLASNRIHPPGKEADQARAIQDELKTALASFYKDIAASKLPKDTKKDGEVLPPEMKVGFKEAFLTHVKPFIAENCVESCHFHTDGSQPFAADDDGKAIPAAQRLVGTSVDDSRMYSKIKAYNHPPDRDADDVEQNIFPKLETALKAFFDVIAKSSGAPGSGINTKSVRISTAEQRWPAMSNVGFMIFEIEGGTIEQGTKLKIQTGPYSNNYAVGTNLVPSHPDGSVRTYLSNACDPTKTPTITQTSHTGSPGDGGVARYVLGISGVFIDGVTKAGKLEKGAEINVPILKMLPFNFNHYPTSTSIPDSIYETAYTIDFDDLAEDDGESDTTKWRDDQIEMMLKAMRDFKNKRKDPKKHQYWIDYFTAIETDITDNGKWAVLKYFRLSSEVQTAQQTITTINPADGKSWTRTVHGNQTVPVSFINDTYGERFTKPGKVTFNFTVPKDSPINGEDPTFKIKMLTLARGNMHVRIVDMDTGAPLAAGNTSCFTFTSATNWTQQTPRLTLTKGQSYTVEVMPPDQAMQADAIMLVADTVENEVADPDMDPTRLRHPIYGGYGGGVQKKVAVMNFALPIGGSLELEVTENEGFYAIEAPMIIPGQENKNFDTRGLDFRINGNLALTDQNFDVDAVRPPHSILAYGQVMIPKDQGPEKDELAVHFARIQPVDDTVKATLPSYQIPPPPKGIECLKPDVFRDKVWPLYSQQLVVRRNEYNQWAGGGYPTTGTGMDEEVAENLQFYTCQSCHNATHPFFPMPNNYEDACDEALARSNMEEPLLSYALRGARGQFNHFPLYVVYNPFVDTQGTFRYYQNLNTTSKFTYGPMLGRLKGQEKSALDAWVASLTAPTNAQKDAVYSNLRRTSMLWIAQDPVSGLPLRRLLTEDPETAVYDKPLTTMPVLGGHGQGTYWDPATSTQFQNEDFVTMFKKPTGEAGDILSDHNAVIDIYVKNFIDWINAEKAARD